MYNRAKISLIGAGNIGGTLAHMIVKENLGDVILFDVEEHKAKGKALDISQAITLNYSDMSIIGTCKYQDIANSDVIVVTAGVARKPGMSRDDLLSINAKIIKVVAQGIKKYSPNALVIIITNPLDAMVSLMHKVSGLSSQKVIGMAGVLDSARLNSFISQELQISIDNIDSMVMGGHGDLMIPIIKYTTVKGIPLPDIIKMGWCTQETIDAIITRTKYGGGEIVSLLKNGSAFYTPAAAALTMISSYLLDQRKIMLCAAYLNGEYNEKDIYIGVPVIIGKNGVEKIIEINLNDSEKNNFKQSIDNIRTLVASIK